ncbi:lysophospholipid acyltransferase family protein [Palleronia sp. LCG004]|uniref:lysophospholipid acyltransferase family protein n=1 Tax=Palleronia sp. LCG004 TaxID=3079304 RepID=UPI0029426C3E|nr:lysophospholipid acyltransferase family protein [Palleronia sp. LCG004]WOI57743.1 lysophospholipid acyltransferase family protein [Palleronia sp. LCG004]
MPSRNETAGGDPVALRSPSMCRFFAGIMRRQMRQGFRAVRLARPGLPDLPGDRPLLVYANHPSWWDPAFFILLAAEIFTDRESYGVIEAPMLEKYRFMRRIGLFGVERDPRRGGAQFLRTGERLMADPARMLWVTAQGGFADPRLRPPELQGGVARLMARCPETVALPLAVEYPFWSEKRPEALALFGTPVTHDGTEPPEALNGRLSAALDTAMGDLADRATARDPAAFTRLLAGRSGVGGIYDAWGRLRAAAQGRRYVADHMEET